MRDALLFAGAVAARRTAARHAASPAFPWGAGGYAHVDGAAGRLRAVRRRLRHRRASRRALALPGSRWRGRAARVAGARGRLAARRRWLLAGVQRRRRTDADATPRGRSCRVALLQGNIPQDEKFEGGTGIPIALDWYGEQLRGSRRAAGRRARDGDPAAARSNCRRATWTRSRDALRATARRPRSSAFRWAASSDGYTNSVVGLGAAARRAYRYDKHHLVPFGEFIPPLFQLVHAT